MSLFAQSLLAYDPDFNQRVTACISNEDSTVDPVAWADQWRWAMAAAPGFADAYSSAIVGNVAHPGRDESVISDGEILSAVQAALAA